MSMKERSWQSEGYRYGFNGKENDTDWEVQDYGFRIYKPELGKFLSVDPLTQSYPELTPYQFASNRPIDGIDLDGLEHRQAIVRNGELASTDHAPTIEVKKVDPNFGKISIVTNVNPDAGFFDGHAWIILTDNKGKQTTLGTWGNTGSQEFFQNKELGQDFAVSRTKPIQQSDIDKINNYNSNEENVDWNCTQTCAGYAAGLWNHVTGERLDAVSWLGTTNPYKLAESIVDANGGKKHNITPKGKEEASSIKQTSNQTGLSSSSFSSGSSGSNSSGSIPPKGDGSMASSSNGSSGGVAVGEGQPVEPIKKE